MATFISLLNFTDQGIRNAKKTVERADTFKKAARKAGVNIQEIYWTLGSYDLVVIAEAPDDETAMSLLLGLSGLGNVRTQTLRAFSGEQMTSIFARFS
jgi:uncharacterized protein with GYD domain